MVYFISDLHFNHSNIIKYCHRPFRSVQSMNNALVRNWNQVVRPQDIVILVGDIAIGDHRVWLEKLNGNIIVVHGSHDGNVGVPRVYYHNFLIVHDPDDAPVDWHGWVIHGHKHNNDMQNYPFINFKNKTINVSVEVIGYRPMSLDKIKMSIGVNSLLS